MLDTTGTRIRRERVRRGWKQADLAAITGLSINTIGNVENDRRTLMNETTLRAIASAFGVAPDELIGTGHNDGNGPDRPRMRAGRTGPNRGENGMVTG